MSRWDDQFEQHAVFAALESTRKQLESVSKAVADAEQTESCARLERVVDYLHGLLKATDPELVPFAVLDQIAPTLNQITSYLEQFAGTSNAADLDSANGQADAVLQQSQALSPRVASGDVQELQSAVSTFRRSAGQLLRNIEAEVEAAKSKAAAVGSQLGDQEAKIQAQDARLDTVVTEYQSQFSDAQAQRQTEFGQALQESQTTIGQAVTKGKADLDDLLALAKSASDEAVAEAKQRADTQYTGLAEAGEKRINELDELLAKAVKTVGVIGSTGMAGGYQIVADDEKKAANSWRWWTVAALVGAIGATIFAVAHGISNGFHVNTFFAKWAISVPFAALAAYAGHESSKHRDQERINRKIELQLASLDAYLVTLDDDKQDEIRSKLADRFFGELRAVAESDEPGES